MRDDPAKRLRVIMAERDVTVQELAWRAGVSERTITDLRRNGWRKPQAETMYRIAEALRVHVNDIWPTA
ncbi:helix-turn-helix domain-containing protein [Alicyclobacillus macrosporangiidus]|uniref:helix-turn-helix domain-containing protein n=1 Tax=Alicyclobacillus macrosporangiidus TaxID=392015 RepID=UPI00049571E7|nr:helix-turn-helix transcriptional regulator [Alicyclobacillus macrosporangiidus]